MEIGGINDVLPYEAYDIKGKDTKKHLRVLTETLLSKGPSSLQRSFFALKTRKKRVEEKIDILSQEVRSAQADIASLDFILFGASGKRNEIQDYLNKEIIRAKAYKEQKEEERDLLREFHIKSLEGEIRKMEEFLSDFPEGGDADEKNGVEKSLGFSRGLMDYFREGGTVMGERSLRMEIDRMAAHIRYVESLFYKQEVDDEIWDYFREEKEAAKKYVALLDGKRTELREQREALKRCVKGTETFLRKTFYKFVKRGVDEAILQKLFKIFAEEVGNIKMDYVSSGGKDAWDCDYKKLKAVIEQTIEGLEAKMESGVVSDEEKAHIKIMIGDMRKFLEK